MNRGLEWGLKCRQEGGETGKGVLGSDGKGLETKKGVQLFSHYDLRFFPHDQSGINKCTMSWVLLTGS